MDLRTAIAASMLPASRERVAAAFKDLRHEGTAGTAFLELLWVAAGRRDALSAGDLDALLAAATRALEVGRQLGLEALTLSDARYPALLACTVNPPPVLWARGHVEHLTSHAVAIVGSRAASPYALQVAERLAADLAGRGIVVASGLARGVDSAAHRGCLRSRGATIAVLGSGLDRIYPAEHVTLAEEIRETGLLVSELAPGAPPLPEHFPARNRIISGISLATVVVEASERSGSLITARCALDQGRDVMAVPGSVLSGRNRGSHALLKDGAKVVESADDILQELGWSCGVSPARPAEELISEPVLSLMDPGEPYELDRLVDLSGLEPSRILAILTDLELRELVKASNGQFVRRP